MDPGAFRTCAPDRQPRSCLRFPIKAREPHAGAEPRRALDDLGTLRPRMFLTRVRPSSALSPPEAHLTPCRRGGGDERLHWVLQASPGPLRGMVVPVAEDRAGRAGRLLLGHSCKFSVRMRHPFSPKMC